MPKPDYVLSFATDEDGAQVFVHADSKGLDVLIRSLTAIQEKVKANVCEHDHLMSDVCGCSDLSLKTLSEDGGVRRVAGHVKIYGWSDEWALKNRLKD